jgi:hemerythrin-like domain-containing protein
MREHGVLKRILLIYGEAIRRMTTNQELPVEVVLDAAGIIRSFVEDYHEKLEEDYLFPRFEKPGKLVDLTKTLRAQHQPAAGLPALAVLLVPAVLLCSPATPTATLLEPAMLLRSA